MMFHCKKTVTVQASNYITCSSINRVKFTELQMLYPKLTNIMRQYIVQYRDPLKIFLIMKLDRMKFFKELPQHIKCDFIYNMESTNFDKGDYMYKNEEESMDMYLIQSGCLEIRTMADKGDIFAIERLYRGSIINHNSFLLKDEMDTDAICVTNLYTYSISIDKVNKLRDKYKELDDALDNQERIIVGGASKREPAIDYIIDDPASETHF